VPLSAAVINLNSSGLFNTGVDNSGTALGAAAADNHWIGTSVGFSGNSFQAQGNTVTGQPFPGWPLPSTQNGTGSAAGPWVASATSSGSPLSQWISFQANVNSEPNTTQEYQYNETFQLGGFIGSTFELMGSFAVDNVILGLLINGNLVNGTPNTGTSGSKTVFDITNSSCTPNCGLTNGQNTITFRVQNTAATSPNPSGLLVEFTSATAAPSTGVPEPATLFGVGMGLSVLGLVYRRRRS